MLKKILALILVPIQIILLVVMLPLMLVFGSGLLSMLVPTKSRATRVSEEDEEEIKTDSGD